MSGQHSCKDCGVVFDSGKSLDVHLHYHKENLMSKWIQQATTSSEDNNNVKKNGGGRPGSSVVAADSSEYGAAAAAAPAVPPPAPGSYHHHYHQDGGLLYGGHENGGVSAFHRIRNFARYHPYQQQAVTSSSSQCEKCGFVTDNILEHMQQAHPPPPPPLPSFPFPAFKEEAQILDLDSQKVHVYPNGEEPSQEVAPWPYDDHLKKEEQVPSPYYHEEEKEKKMYYEEKRYMLEENGNGSPDFGGVSTTSSDVMQYYEPMREAPKLPPMMKPVGGASWKSNEARRPKTYNCTACNKWFTSSGHLKRHYNTTLHKNAVKQSGVMDPATLPISAHHHPQKDDEANKPEPPQQFPYLPEPELHQELHYPQYPNALPPHATIIGREVCPLPSFQQGFQQVLDFPGVGGLYDPFGEFHEEEDIELDVGEAEAILPDVNPVTTAPQPVPTVVIKEEPVTSSVPVQRRPPPQPQPQVTSSVPTAVHKCIDCDKTFNKACYLTQHNKSFHSGDKPYKCSRCGKRFTQEYLHLKHLSKHGDDKPHKCEICPKQFNHKTDLRRHMCLHSGDKPFPCDYCGKGFIRKDHMLKHSETHKRKQQHHGLLHQRPVFVKKPPPLLDSNMNPTLQVQ